eukprot:1153481-Pelagomonas_calceolata.AAC.11
MMVATVDARIMLHPAPLLGSGCCYVQGKKGYIQNITYTRSQHTCKAHAPAALPPSLLPPSMLLSILMTQTSSTTLFPGHACTLHTPHPKEI